MKTNLKCFALLFTISILSLGCSKYIMIPDKEFENYLILVKYDSDLKPDGKIKKTEAEKIHLVDITQTKLVKSIKGVQKFINLEKLAFSGHPDIKAVNLSKLTHLETLDLSETGISSLNLENNKNLKYLYCHNLPNLKELDLANQDSLITLECFRTGLTQLDLRKKNKLVFFRIIKTTTKVNVCVDDPTKIPSTWDIDESINYMSCSK